MPDVQVFRTVARRLDNVALLSMFAITSRLSETSKMCDNAGSWMNFRLLGCNANTPVNRFDVSTRCGPLPVGALGFLGSQPVQTLRGLPKRLVMNVMRTDTSRMAVQHKQPKVTVRRDMTRFFFTRAKDSITQHRCKPLLDADDKQTRTCALRVLGLLHCLQHGRRVLTDMGRWCVYTFLSKVQLCSIGGGGKKNMALKSRSSFCIHHLSGNYKVLAPGMTRPHRLTHRSAKTRTARLEQH